MSIKPEQLTIWTFLDRVVAAPIAANTVDLSNWIGSLDLDPAGDALVTWANSYRDRAIQMLDEWKLKSPLTLVTLVEPFYDGSLFDDLVLGRMEWDLGDLVETIEADYPIDRQVAPTIVPMSKDAALARISHKLIQEAFLEVENINFQELLFFDVDDDK